MKVLGRLFLLLAWLATPLAGTAEDAALRESLFAETDARLAEAREVQAALLAPRSFERAMEAYRDASERLQREQALTRIRADIAEASEQLAAAISQSRSVAPSLAGALKAREAAVGSGAEQSATALFAEADEALKKLTYDLERGRSRDMPAQDAALAGAYRDAELAAIKAGLLSATRERLAAAEEMRAERYAPTTLARARKLLQEADKALTEDRYDSDRPRSLARQADYEARHAIYLTGRFRAVREGSLDLETLVGEWERAMGSIAAAADLEARFDQGADPVAGQITGYVTALQAENARLLTTLSDRDQTIAQMELEIRDLEERLGGVARERSQLAERLERQAQDRLRYLQVEALFEPQEEAVVIRDGGEITLRLVGLKFGVGQSDIGAENFALLSKVQSAIRIFPDARLVVDGHTDSFGSDQKNLQLSRDRAEAVRQYLLANMRLNPGQISAEGYGESRPIANNETAEGRARNRRIEVRMFTAGADTP